MPIYRCPRLKTPLKYEQDALIAQDGTRYPIRDGIADFLSPTERNDNMDYYNHAAVNYDDVAHLSFTIQKCDEEKTRRHMASRLQLQPNHKVLEIACGTGRDSVYIAEQLSDKGELYLFDISEAMLRKCQQKLSTAKPTVEYALGNACALPYPDGYFDSVFSFGGLSVFDDIALSLAEMVRVIRVGGRIVVGDESLAPWLYDSEYGKILLNNNPLFKAKLPLEQMPVQARNVHIEWIIGGVYYLIDFTVGKGEPEAEFDMPIPGQRGGSLRTRYEGKLEGVTPEALEIMEKARAQTGKSKHQWLEDAIRLAAKQS
ncbi:MAG: class I SAM-dependent methyltransferase [Rickettsiales bacterium]|nr:class I SAM-dependent methyltransferase [Rickettsiales bacterium]